MLDSLPPVISTFGADIDGVMVLIYWIVGAWFVAAELLLLFFLLRYRKRHGVRAGWVPGTSRRAWTWILIPAGLVLVCDLVIEAQSSRVWATVKEDMPRHAVLVRITAAQFNWTFTYAGADGQFDTDDDFGSPDDGLVVPRGQVVRFQLESADVLHSLWIPQLRLKQDVVPGRSIPGWFEATREGEYAIACAELCGVAHTYMKSRLHVVSPQAWSAWAAGRRHPVLAEGS